MKISLLICTYNRPNYLKRCFESLRLADLSAIKLIVIVDDCSSNEETLSMVKNFDMNGCDLYILGKETNCGIKDSLKRGYQIAFNRTDIVINIDGDAIVRNDFVKVLIGLKKKFPDNIVCGFNTLVKNRNPIIEEYESFYKKKYASGINMVINKQQYNDYILPALGRSIGNWDFDASKLHEADRKAVIIAKPSVIQHIGVEESSMGHISASEPPDVATDFKLLHLPDITLIGVDGFDIDRLIKAADISCRDIQFGAVKLLTDLPSTDERVIPIRPINSKKDYSQFILKELVDYIDTKYLLIIQHDGYVLNASAWSDDFLKYDMIGAAWKFRKEKRTANGGFSLRSRRMCEAIKNDNSIFLRNDHIINNYAEDHVCFYIYREYLETVHSVKIAPEEVCDKFSIEAWGLKPPFNNYSGQFGFHGYSVNFKGTNLSHIPYIKNF